MKGVSIFAILPANAADLRGPTWEWKLPDNIQLTVCKRKAGSASCHYHKGFDKSKDPERMFLASGRLRIIFTRIGSKETYETIVEEGSTISIDPNIIHKVEVLEDAVIIEYRITHFHKLSPDTYPGDPVKD